MYDEHPSTVCLVTFGSDFLAALLAEVDPPKEAAERGLARSAAAVPLERVGWYAIPDGAATPPRSLSRLQEVLAQDGGGDDSGQPPNAARVCFEQEIAPIRQQEEVTAQAKKRSRSEPLAEKIRDLLL